MKITIEKPDSEEQIDISVWQWLELKIRGYTYYKQIKEEGWNESLPLYIAHCKVHDHYYLSYPHGYEGRLDCDLCEKDHACAGGVVQWK